MRIAAWHLDVAPYTGTPPNNAYNLVGIRLRHIALLAATSCESSAAFELESTPAHADLVAVHSIHTVVIALSAIVVMSACQAGRASLTPTAPCEHATPGLRSKTDISLWLMRSNKAFRTTFPLGLSLGLS